MHNYKLAAFLYAFSLKFMKNLWMKGTLGLMKDTFSNFSEYKVPKLSASLAYYTVFSIGPLLIVIISLCSLFLGREAIEGSIYS